MKASSVSPGARVVSFEFVDVTNLAKPTDGHMQNLEITFTDDDRITYKWTWRENGRTTDNTFTLARVQ
jgi:YD repeat-containing protein